MWYFFNKRKTIRPRTLIANLPVVGRYLYPYRNHRSIFLKSGDLSSNANAISLSEYPNPKILVVGLPKSGNVWLQSLISDALGLDRVLLKNSEQKGVGITHQVFQRSLALRRDFARGVYVIRDLRDIVISYYHYSQTDDYRKNMDRFCYYSNISQFYFEYFVNRVLPRYDWINHPAGYIRRGFPMVKYENLWDRPVEELKYLFMRLGLHVEDEPIENAVKTNSISSLRKKGKQTHRTIPNSHFRKGGYGGYKENLPDSVRKDIETRFEDFLVRWGYSIG